MDPLIQLAAGVSAIALGSRAYSLVRISESAQNFNYCVEQKTDWWKEKDGDFTHEHVLNKSLSVVRKSLNLLSATYDL